MSVLVLLAAKLGPIELSWYPSPDRDYDAVLLAVGDFGGPGLGSSGSCELYVVQASEEATDLPRSRRVFFARRITNDVDFRWKDDRILEIRYSSTELSDFRNFVPLGAKAVSASSSSCSWRRPRMGPGCLRAC